MKRVAGWLGELMKETGKSRRDLLVLSDNNDPYYAGTTSAQRKAAEWFARMWEQEYKGQTGIHLRRCHYHIDAIKLLKTNGMPYTNSTRDWDMLLYSSKWARILRLVPADAFDDHRNQDPYPLAWRTSAVREPTIFGLEQQYNWSLPMLASSDWTLETPQVAGYAPDDYLDRAYLLELWIEKSTMDDILVPLTDELGVRLVPSSGYQSISNAVKFLERVHEIGKPGRIFYISDHDEAGRKMPIAVARQIEFWRQHYAPDSDVKLIVLALTKEQIARYKLPSSVEKKDAVELDALEALAPGELENIVRRAIEPYLDETIGTRRNAAEREAQETVRQAWSRVIGPHKRALETLNRRVEQIRKKYQKRLKRELAPFKKPLARLQAEMAEATLVFRPTLPARPLEAVSDLDEQNCLFDSSRPYLEQLRFYKSQKPDGKKRKQ